MKIKFIFLLAFLYIIVIIAPVISLFFEKVSAQDLSQYFLSTRVREIFLNTVLICTLSALLATALGISLGLILEFVKIPFKRIFFSIFLLPLLIPPYTNAIGWIKLLGKQGVITKLVMDIFNLSKPLLTLYSVPGVIFIYTISFSPFAFLLIIAGLRSLDFHLIEAARLSNRGLKILTKILLPSLLPYICAVFLFIFVLSLDINAEFLGINVYSIEIYMQFCAYHDFKHAVIISLPVVILILLLGFFLGRILKQRPLVNFARGYRNIVQSKNFIVKILSLTFFFFISIVFLTPFVQYIKMIGSFSNFLRELEISWPEITDSIFYGTMGGFFAITFAFLVAFLILALKKYKFASFLNLFSFIPLAVPTSIFALGLIKIFNREFLKELLGFFYCSSFVVPFLFMLKFHPYGVRVLLKAIGGIKKELKEVAKLITKSKLYYLKKIVIPLINPFVLIMFFICFLFSFQEISGSILLIPAGDMTLPIKVENIAHYGAYGRIASLSLMEALIPLILFVLILPFVRINYDRTQKYN